MRPDWRPIETAPKDGTLILLCRAGYQPVLGLWLNTAALKVARVHYHDRHDGVWMAFDPGGYFESDDDLRDFIKGDYSPTHWADCPEGPDLE